MKNIQKLTDRQLALTARSIEAEKKVRANRKAAAMAILAILKKHKLSVNELSELNLGQKRKTRTKKKTSSEKARSAKETIKDDDARATKVKNASADKNDKRSEVAFKYKDPKGVGKWSGRGRAPRWVTEIIAKKRISMERFKADKRYKI